MTWNKWWAILTWVFDALANWFVWSLAGIPVGKQAWQVARIWITFSITVALIGLWMWLDESGPDRERPA